MAISATEALSHLFGPSASPFGAPGLPSPRYTIGQFYADHGQPVPSYLHGFEDWTFDELNKARQAQQQAADLSGIAQQASLLSKDYSAYNNANFGSYTPFEQFAKENASPDVASYVMGQFNPQAAVPASAPGPTAAAALSTPLFGNLSGGAPTQAPSAPVQGPPEPPYGYRLQQAEQGVIGRDLGPTAAQGKINADRGLIMLDRLIRILTGQGG